MLFCLPLCRLLTCARYMNGYIDVLKFGRLHPFGRLHLSLKIFSQKLFKFILVSRKALISRYAAEHLAV